MKRLLTLAFSLFAALVVMADSRSEFEMLQIAERQLFGKPTRSMAFSSLKKLDARESFNIYGADGHGFVVVSTDDAFDAVLGKSDTDYMTDNLPAGFIWWMNAINESLEYQKQNGIAKVTAKSVTPIAPILKSSWGQGDPYNRMSPTVDGTKAPTGCLATAMGQVMRHYKYPAKGKGMQKYTVVDSKGKKTTKYHQITNTYDWDKMRDVYGFIFSDEEADAVSKLMIDCGAAVKMEYTSSSSGAQQSDAALALINNFGYNEVTLQEHWQMYYNDEEWFEMIYRELSNNNPLIYRGQDDIYGGHAFIFDGMDAEGKVHVNWGWSGTSDGYFNFNALTPTQGGRMQNFSDMTAMLTGVRPTAPTEDDVYATQWATDDKYSFSINSSNTIDFYVGNLYNIDFRTFNGDIFIILENTNGKIEESVIITLYSSKSYTDQGKDGSVPSLYGFTLKDDFGQLSKFSFSDLNYSKMPAGTYRAYMATVGYTKGEYLQYLRYIGGPLVYTLTKAEDGKMTVADGDPLLTGIDGIEAGSNSMVKGIFNLNGMQMPMMQKGINIMKAADGSVKKVLVK